ncbi:hypothetical protein [Pseudomonas sp. AN3A02]|uniref:hypothetical protein n=1 Tax=Pseudomonas sp. AN3A02 TaxID=2719587 RepID=UPI001430205F|nr:hypothetical protein [Pseudomonas sp. AN3A02]NIL16552.1 hypothetical protein [Pseudomonas sp. AN3A02]
MNDLPSLGCGALQPGPGASSSEEACETLGGAEVGGADVDFDDSESDHPIDGVIKSFIHRVLDIEDCASTFVTIARTEYAEKFNELLQEYKECQEPLGSQQSVEDAVLQQRKIRAVVRSLERHSNSSPTQTLERSLFINIFASYDKFVGELLLELYRASPNLYKGVNREIALCDVLAFESIDELKLSLLEKEIETIKRKSYIEQFKDLGTRFGLTLTKFDSWPKFVECGQRRNLFTHCDGVVSQQYLQTCQEHKVKLDKAVGVGSQLALSAKYFYETCSVVTEVAIMLAHTLWRKLLPEQLGEADSCLNSLIFDYLHLEHWSNAISLSKFALSLPKVGSDVHDRMFHINYAIALRGIGEVAAAKTVLDKRDWSASIYDFRLAYAVLTDDLNLASELMLRIGSRGEFLAELSYHDWPLFREFRETPEFRRGYKAVYGYEYATKLYEIAEDMRQDVLEQVSCG